MSEIDKIIHKLSNIQNWLRAGKDNEAIRDAMYQSAAKVCHEVCGQIEQLTDPISIEE